MCFCSRQNPFPLDIGVSGPITAWFDLALLFLRAGADNADCSQPASPVKIFLSVPCLSFHQACVQHRSFRVIVRAGEMAQLVKCLSCKFRGLSSIPSTTHIKNPGIGLHVCNPSSWKTMTGRSLGAHWSGSTTSSVSSRLVTSIGVKKKKSM